MKYEICMIWTSDQIKKIQTKNMKTVHDDKKNALILIKKFYQNYFLWSVLTEWIRKEN